ncbi:MAG: aromatic acid exporter family protein [Lachnospiraceae bacterium]|nr:aromatic acid exporter family protein [Lachnospiraceae bacterium]
MNKRTVLQKRFLKAAKISVGSGIAIFIAILLGLDYEVSAGTIALLTLVTTKWGTIRLSLYRLITLVISIVLAVAIFSCIGNEWLAFGIYVFCVVFICEVFGWAATVSVNAVIGAHLLTSLDFSARFIYNEVMLVLIGVSVAIVLNLIHNYKRYEKELIESMRKTEARLQELLEELAVYLRGREALGGVWENVQGLEEQIGRYYEEAKEYQENTFASHPGYYMEYFVMRRHQCAILGNLYHSISQIRSMPTQAGKIADYLVYLKDYVVEKNAPEEQIERLHQVFRSMEKEPMPVSREEFESRAILYHVLLELEEFLNCKKGFVEGMDETKKLIYWGNHLS